MSDRRVMPGRCRLVGKAPAGRDRAPHRPGQPGTELLAAVSHELRSPLAIIKGYTTMLLDYERCLSRAERRRCVQAISRAVERLVELVDSLLDVSRLEAGFFRIERRPVDICRLVGDAVAEATVAVPGRPVTARLVVPAAPVLADAGRIRQLLDNLLDNAIKFSPEGSPVEVEVRRLEGVVQVSVTDHGAGIPPEEQERIFDRFYRGQPPGAGLRGGLGLGLTLCRGIVQAHGGRLWVESEPGRGSTFYFTLPEESPRRGQGEA